MTSSQLSRTFTLTDTFNTRAWFSSMTPNDMHLFASAHAVMRKAISSYLQRKTIDAAAVSASVDTFFVNRPLSAASHLFLLDNFCKLFGVAEHDHGVLKNMSTNIKTMGEEERSAVGGIMYRSEFGQHLCSLTAFAKLPVQTQSDLMRSCFVLFDAAWGTILEIAFALSMLAESKGLDPGAMSDAELGLLQSNAASSSFFATITTRLVPHEIKFRRLKLSAGDLALVVITDHKPKMNFFWGHGVCSCPGRPYADKVICGITRSLHLCRLRRGYTLYRLFKKYNFVVRFVFGDDAYILAFIFMHLNNRG
ncbi:hypothetical protein N9O24_01050, partial [bacterium]|nr:hypothetical protein [bacterium]